MLGRGQWSSALRCWSAQAIKALAAQPESHSQLDLLTCVSLLKSAGAALALVTDVGHEAAVRYLSREFALAAQQARLACRHAPPSCR